MKTNRIWLASLLLLPLGAAAAFSQEKKAAPAAAPTDDPMLAKMMEFGTPGPSHKVLDAKVGKWSAKVKMISPDSPPTESAGTSEVKWIMDGRYLQDTYTGDFMGQPFHGMGTTGFDIMKKKYVGTWIDSMSTAIAMSEGTYDAAKKTFTYSGESPDPMAGKYVKSRTVETWTDADHWTMQYYSPGPDGKELMSMEIQYSRAK